MARQRIHNRRAGHGGGSGASWISYSDMMASLLLVFVLMLCYSLYQYFTVLETKTKELDAQQAIVAAQQTELDAKSAELLNQQTTLQAQEAQLQTQKTLLAAQQSALESKQTELDAANAALLARETELEALQATVTRQQQELQAQTDKIDDLVGVRGKIIRQLSSALSSANLKATVDPTTGDIVLDSAVFFETASNEIKEEGKALLNRFIPVYLGVLLQEEYSPYLGEIIIEGHTDTVGSYMTNLQLSQKRALTVAQYCLEMPSLSAAQRQLLQKILTATGRSYSDPVYAPDGSVDMDASRRVEFQFSLRDAEMIEEMNRLLQADERDGSQ